MTLLTLKQEHKKHILFLTEQTSQVLQDFCKLAIDYIQRGPNVKLYSAAAQKLAVDFDIIKNSIEGLVNLLLESYKCKLNTDDFRDSVVALGFSQDKEMILTKLYEIKKNEISNVLTHIGLKLPAYHNLEWRFEVKASSRSLLKQVAPLITLDLSLKSSKNMDDVEHILFQTDPNNLLHIAQELEEALREGRNQHIRRISGTIK